MENIGMKLGISVGGEISKLIKYLRANLKIVVLLRVKTGF